MEKIIKNDVIKIRILKELSGEILLTPSMLASNINCKYETVMNSLLFLEHLGIVKKQNEKHGKKIYTQYRLTDLGRKVLNNIKPA